MQTLRNTKQSLNPKEQQWWIREKGEEEEAPGADGTADADGEGALLEVSRRERRRPLVEVAGGVDGLVRVPRQAIVGVVNPTIRPYPRHRRLVRATKKN